MARAKPIEIEAARNPKLPFRQEFTRFKYAEEFAYDLDRDGRPWVMYRGADKVHEEDGEEYGEVYGKQPRYIVLYGA